MTTYVFDTLSVSRRLKDAGLEAKQAEAIVDSMVASLSEVATKRDLEILENRLVIKMGAMLVAAVSLTIALFKYL